MSTSAPVHVAAILLAAGSGSRFGADKLMYPLPDGTPIAVQSARHLMAAWDDVRQATRRTAVAVIRPGSDALARALEAEGLRVVVCADAASGMGHSLALAVREAGRADGHVVALGDMPFIKVASIVAVRQAIENGASIAAPRFAGQRGHPMGFGAMHAAALAALTGDEGARRLVAAHHADIRYVDVADPGILQDIDTPGDLASRLA